MARQALGIAGGVVGFYFGGPAGAKIGFALGSAAGGYVDPEKIQGPKIQQAPVQTGSPGVPIPRGWGLFSVRPNLLRQTELREVEEEESSKKGGGPSLINTRYYQTFAHGLCEGPIAGIRRIWENDKLVVDFTETPAIEQEETDAYWAGLRLYFGDSAQLPDPDLEAEFGVGNQPYYRGLAYIVHVDKDLTDFGAAHPQMMYEVIGGADATVTSRPYPIEALDAVDAGVTPILWQELKVPLDGVNVSLTPQSWQINTLLNAYSYTEGIDVSMAPQSWLVETRLESYSYTEGVDASITPQSWLVELRLVSYDYEDEGVDVSVAPLTWTVEAP